MRIAVSRLPGAARDVSPLELFFDLVYVFAIEHLSHHLVVHLDLRTGAEAVIMALAVLYAWYMVGWGANWLDPDPPSRRASGSEHRTTLSRSSALEARAADPAVCRRFPFLDRNSSARARP